MNYSDVEISEDDSRYIEEDANSESNIFSESGEHEGLITMNQTSRKLYHQKKKEIQVILLIIYIISWRYRRMIMNSKVFLIINLRMEFFLYGEVCW